MSDFKMRLVFETDGGKTVLEESSTQAYMSDSGTWLFSTLNSFLLMLAERFPGEYAEFKEGGF